VFRPYTLVDVLGQLNQQSSQQQGSIVNAIGAFAEADEQTTLSDSMTTTVQVSPAYDAGVWGAFTWT
jgi:hemoglobin-like flavoprotein